MRILVVEDNEKSLKLFGIILRSMGHEVLSAGDGEAGVRIALAAAPGLILMDIQMPIERNIFTETVERTLKECHGNR